MPLTSDMRRSIDQIRDYLFDSNTVVLVLLLVRDGLEIRSSQEHLE